MIQWIRCKLGFHSITSYAEVTNYNAESMIKISKVLGFKDAIDRGFIECCAIRCKHCNYKFKGETENNFQLVENINNE